MKRIILILLLLIFIVGCAQEQEPTIEKPTTSESPEVETTEPIAEPSEIQQPTDQEKEESKPIKISSINPNPIDSLSNELIERWSANCKDKATDLEKAQCILDWQEKNIFWCYTHLQETVMPKMFETGYPDCVVDMQFQQMVPGSFPVSKIFDLKLRNNKLFGACYTYAVTYCALARRNGLTCRVIEVEIVTPQTYSASQGDYGAGYCGAAQKSYLDALGLDCEEWKTSDWTINYDHYWAEVLIDGQWQIMERPTWAYQRDTQKYIIDAGRNYINTGW